MSKKNDDCNVASTEDKNLSENKWMNRKIIPHNSHKFRKITLITAAILAGGSGLGFGFLKLYTANAQGEDAGGYGTTIEFYNDWTDTVAETATIDKNTEKIFSGDWNANDIDSLAVKDSTLKLYNDYEDGLMSSFKYWNANDFIFSGDWNGDGLDTFGARVKNNFYIRDEFGDGSPDYSFTFGDVDDAGAFQEFVLVGDFHGTGHDGLALRSGNTFKLLNGLNDASAETVIFGDNSDVSVVDVGDWDGNGTDTPLVRIGNIYRAYNSWNYADGYAYQTEIGSRRDAVLVGDWDGDGKDTLALRKYDYKFNGNKKSVTTADTAAINTNPDIRLRADAATSLERVQEIWGKPLQLNDGFRPFETQKEIFLSRYTPQKTGGGEFCDVRTFDGTRYVRTSELGPAAVPGTSNHGWGNAADIGGFESFGDEERLKFLALAKDYGWSDAEGCAVNERWHMTYDPTADKGMSDWSPDDPVNKSVSHCPDKVITPSTTVEAKDCKYD